MDGDERVDRNSYVGSDCVGANFSVPVEYFLFLLFSGILFSIGLCRTQKGPKDEDKNQSDSLPMYCALLI